MKSTVSRGPLSLPGMLAFAATSIPIAALQLAISVHLPRYFASHLGLSLTLVGSAFALVRAIDIPLDPLLGLAMDRTRTRIGRYRAWVIGAAPVLMFAFYLLISSEPGVSQAHLVLSLLLMYAGYSGIYLSQLAWAATLAPSYEQRSRIFGVLSALGVTGAVAVLVIPVVAEKLGHTDAQGVEAMIWFIIGAIPITTLIVVSSTPEHPARETSTRFALGDYFGLLKRVNVLRLLAAELCVTLGPGWMAALYLFYFKDVRGFNTTQANLLLMLYIAAGFIGAPGAAWLANRIGKPRTLLVSTTTYALLLAILPVYPKGSFMLLAPGMVLNGAMATSFVVMLRALTGDVGDEVRLETGRESMGLLYALTNAMTKLGQAGAIFLTFRVLDAVHYHAREGAANSPAALHGLELAYLIGPIVFVMIGGACFLRYGLTPARHAEIRSELERMEAIYAEPAVLEPIGPEPATPIPEPR